MVTAPPTPDDGRRPLRWRPIRARRRTVLLSVVAVLVTVMIGGCSPLRYYTQAVWGGAKLIVQRRPIDQLLQRGHLSPQIQEKLETALDIRDFASRELGLPDNRSYRSYVETGRDAVAWNVVATPELSMQPLVWCFPIAGCVTYRGYFKKERAERFAEQLAEQGNDTRLVPVTGFSTLGWFADPVIDTFLRYPDWQLAGLLFHELSHQVVYVDDDTTFNESFATTVEIEGVRRWLEESDRTAEIELATVALERQANFRRLLLKLRACLEETYASSAEVEAKRRRKAALFDWAQREGKRGIQRGEISAGYGGWFVAPLNNADVASIADYEAYVPAFKELFDDSGSFPEFYRRVAELAELDREQRTLRLGPELDPEMTEACPTGWDAPLGQASGQASH